jgi:hypothetical protein
MLFHGTAGSVQRWTPVQHMVLTTNNAFAGLIFTGQYDFTSSGKIEKEPVIKVCICILRRGCCCCSSFVGVCRNLKQLFILAMILSSLNFQI